MAPWSEERKASFRKIMCGNQNAKGYRHSEETKARMKGLQANEKHWMWKGSKASYSAIHKWLNKNFGKPTHCENKLCPEKGTRIEYALKLNKHHSHNRSHYIMLCQSCHGSYDSRRRKIPIKL